MENWCCGVSVKAHINGVGEYLLWLIVLDVVRIEIDNLYHS